MAVRRRVSSSALLWISVGNAAVWIYLQSTTGLVLDQA